MEFLNFILSLVACIIANSSCLCLSITACNDLFSRFEQQTSILEKLAEAMDPTTDRQGHDGPLQGLVSEHLENLKLGNKNRLSELCDGMAGRTVTGVMDRHRPLVEILGL